MIMAQTYVFGDIPALKERVVLTDANAILFIFWPELNRYSDTATLYEKAFGRLVAQGTRLVVTMNIISEVTNKVFNYRWEYWNNEQLSLGLKPVYNYKRFRNSTQGLAIMNDIDDFVKNFVLEDIHVVGEKQFDDSDAFVLLVAEKIDLADKIIAATAKAHNYIVFTHDGDFLYADADVLTANGKIFHRQR